MLDFVTSKGSSLALKNKYPPYLDAKYFSVQANKDQLREKPHSNIFRKITSISPDLISLTLISRDKARHLGMASLFYPLPLSICLPHFGDFELFVVTSPGFRSAV